MTPRYGHGVGTGFLEGLLVRDLSVRRTALLDHPLWRGVETGTATLGHLRQFAVQDAFLVHEIHRLDGLAIAKAPDAHTADHLVRKLVPKAGALELVARFGEAVGLDRALVERPRPLAGCAALVFQFYHHLVRSSFAETVACIGASETIFLEICGRVEDGLRRHYGLSEEAIAFFAFHDGLEEAERGTSGLVAGLVASEEAAAAVTDAVELCYELELLFYDTVWANPLD